MSSASSRDAGALLGNTDEMMRSGLSVDGAQASDASDEEDEDEIVACKRCEREWLAPEDWARDGLASCWPALREKLLRTSTPIAREDAAALTRARFAAEYEAKRRPCVVANRDAAREPLALAALLDEFGDLNWRVSDTHGQMVGLREWWAYARATDDDAPFGIYDAEFGDEGTPTARLAAAYDVPAFAAEDAFARAAAGPRPPWRWILMGGPRSGTGMHVDPLHTHAWVHLCEGRKRWLMLPPDTTAAALATVGVAEGRQLPSGQFFARHGDAAADLPGAVEFVQEAGELVYVPAGWTHAVLNLDATVAVTHNYATLTPACVEATAKEEPEFFMRLLRGFSPGAFPRARRVSRRDPEAAGRAGRRGARALLLRHAALRRGRGDEPRVRRAPRRRLLGRAAQSGLRRGGARGGGGLLELAGGLAAAVPRRAGGRRHGGGGDLRRAVLS